MNFYMYEKMRTMFLAIATEAGNMENGMMLSHDWFKTRFNQHLSTSIKPANIAGYVSSVRGFMEKTINKSLINVRGEGWTVVSLEEKQHQQTTKREKKQNMSQTGTFAHSAMVLGHRGKWSAEMGIFALNTIRQKGRTKEAIRIISDKVGVTESSVTQKLAEYGKAARDQRYSQLSLEEGITQYHMDGCPLAPHKLTK